MSDKGHESRNNDGESLRFLKPHAAAESAESTSETQRKAGLVSAPAHKEPTTAKRKDIRAEVCERAAGQCESCGKWVGEDGADAHLDHRFGRGAGRPAESVENCWLLCIACDHSRTTNSPSAAYWWGRFILHAQRYGFTAEAQLADTKLETLKAKGLVTR